MDDIDWPRNGNNRNRKGKPYMKAEAEISIAYIAGALELSSRRTSAGTLFGLSRSRNDSRL
jgi:hypothetical protein